MPSASPPSGSPPGPSEWNDGATSVRRVESRFTGSGGRPLFRRSWLPEAEPRRVIAVVHGFAEHSGRYDHLGAWLARRGCAVHGYDQRGHGRSAEKLGRLGPFSGLLDDLDAFLEYVADEHPGIPRFLIGHSMGGLVVAAHLRERRPELTAAVLSAPALALSDDLSPLRRRVSGWLGRVWPSLRIRAGIDPAGLTHDARIVQRYLEDPLVFDDVEVGSAASMLEAVERTATGGSDVLCPVLLLHGDADPICAPAASQRFFSDLRRDESALRLYPGLLHEIFNEPEHERVFQDLLDWIEERETSSDALS